MLAEIHAMLTANARANSMMTIIDGWTLFQNSDAGPYVGLYNTFKGKRDGRVYVYGFAANNQSQRPLNADFRKLPKRLQDEVLALLAKEQPPEAPRSEFTEYVTQRGYLRKCQPFKVIRYKYGMFDENGNKVEKKDEDKNDPWRIERCFDIGNSNRQPAEPTAQQPTAQSPAQQPPAQQPTAQSPERLTKIRTMFAEAKTVYGEAGAQAAILKIASEVAGKNVINSASLTDDELRKTALIVNIDYIGIQQYKDAKKWYRTLAGNVGKYGKQTVYEMTIADLTALKEVLTRDIPF